MRGRTKVKACPLVDTSHSKESQRFLPGLSACVFNLEQNLKLARIPIPPHPRGDSSDSHE